MRKLFLSIYIIFALVLIFAAGGFFYVYRQIKTPIAMVGQGQQVVIDKGLSIEQIAAKLENKRLIRSAFCFKVYVYFEGINNLQAGDYTLNPSMSISEIATIISGGLVNRNEARVTIPEGFTVKQIDERLARAGLIETGKLIVVASERSKRSNLVEAQRDPSASPRDDGGLGLEGYLFPDTYAFDKNAKLDEVAQKMLDNFDKKVTPEIREEIERQGKTLNDVIIMASIVQQEAVSAEEMPRIAGVFYNRLAINMPLQADATVNYVTGKGMRQALTEDTKIDSPYNTYKYKGLPPGPICNPGLDAIKAAIWPEKNDYYYFLHPLSAPTVFSKTEEDHRANKAKWLK